MRERLTFTLAVACVIETANAAVFVDPASIDRDGTELYVEASVGWSQLRTKIRVHS